MVRGLAELGLAADHRLVGLVGGVAEREDLGDVDAVVVGETALAVEAALAVGCRGEHDALALEVGQRGDALGLGVVLGDEEGVGVGGRRDVEQLDPGVLEQAGAVVGELLAVAGLERLGLVAVGLGVEEVDDAADVFGDDVDVAGEGRHVGVARVDQLGVHRVAGVLQELLVHRGDEGGLREVLPGDGHRALVAAAGGAGVVGGVVAGQVVTGTTGEGEGAGGENHRKRTDDVHGVPSVSRSGCCACPDVRRQPRDSAGRSTVAPVTDNASG